MPLRNLHTSLDASTIGTAAVSPEATVKSVFQLLNRKDLA